MNRPVYDYKIVGERIRRKRKQLGLTQEQLAESIERSQKYCADIERGSCGMSVDMMLRLCFALRMSPSTLLLGEALPSLDDADIISQITTGLTECTEEQKENILQTIRLFTRR